MLVFEFPSVVAMTVSAASAVSVRSFFGNAVALVEIEIFIPYPWCFFFEFLLMIKRLRCRGPVASIEAHMTAFASRWIYVPVVLLLEFLLVIKQ